MKTFTFRGKRWRIVDTDSGMGGECQGPHMKNRNMTVPMDGSTQRDLDVCIHEALHACLWDLDEETVEESASDIARFLWRLGWRKEE